MKRVEAKYIKVGDKITLDGTECKVTNIEFSDIGKHGTKKCRITAIDNEGDMKVAIKPDNALIEKK